MLSTPLRVFRLFLTLLAALVAIEEGSHAAPRSRKRILKVSFPIKEVGLEKSHPVLVRCPEVVAAILLHHGLALPLEAAKDLERSGQGLKFLLMGFEEDRVVSGTMSFLSFTESLPLKMYIRDFRHATRRSAIRSVNDFYELMKRIQTSNDTRAFERYVGYLTLNTRYYARVAAARMLVLTPEMPIQSEGASYVASVAEVLERPIEILSLPVKTALALRWAEIKKLSDLLRLSSSEMKMAFERLRDFEFLERRFNRRDLTFSKELTDAEWRALPLEKLFLNPLYLAKFHQEGIENLGELLDRLGDLKKRMQNPKDLLSKAIKQVETRLSRAGRLKI